MVTRKDHDDSFHPGHVIKGLTGSGLAARLTGNLDTGKAAAAQPRAPHALERILRIDGGPIAP
jgi:hypothetical protein